MKRSLQVLLLAALGFLGSSQPNLNGIYYLGPLNQVLTSKGLAHVTGP